MAGARAGDWRLSGDGTATVGGVTLQPDEFELTARARPGHEVAEDGDLLVALDTTLDAELEAAGFAREVAHRLQALRREAGFEISDRVVVAIGCTAEAAARLDPHLQWLRTELLATEMSLGLDLDLPNAADRATVVLDGETVELAVARA
jgi:isoleucyl-tRNA synthetase